MTEHVDVKYEKFSKEHGKFPNELKQVSLIAEQLRAYLETELVCIAIREVHKLHGSSQQVQSLLKDKLSELDFKSEKKGLFKEYKVPSLRPDFYREVGNSGILVEIERGKTIANNMDLLDIWKCHLCTQADFLFLVVPCERKNNKGQVTRTFDRVSKRMKTFFEPSNNYVNVEAVYLFGY
jgi:hypothetical protein